MTFPLSIPRPRRVVKALMMALVALFCIVAFAGTPSAEAKVRLLTPVLKKPPALDFVLEDLNRNVWQLSKLKGKVVVINFWAISCPVCRVEMPTLERFWKKMSRLDVQVLTIHVGHSESEVRSYVAKHNLKLPILHDPKKSIARSWGVFNLPVTFVLNPDGRVAYVAFGGRNWMNPTLARMILALQPPL